jgi:hypothetical protein
MTARISLSDDPRVVRGEYRSVISLGLTILFDNHLYAVQHIFVLAFQFCVHLVNFQEQGCHRV